jgi:hypothetical protein
LLAPGASRIRRAWCSQHNGDAGGDHDGGAEQDARRRRFSEDEIAERSRPDHRNVVKDGDDRRVGEAITVGHQDLPTAAEEADCRQARKLEQGRHDEALARGEVSEGPTFRPKRRDDKDRDADDGGYGRKIEDDRARRFRLGQPSGLDHRHRRRTGAEKRHYGADARRGDGCPLAEMPGQHHENPGKPGRDRRRARQAKLLAEHDRGQRHDHKRSGEGEGGGVGERQGRESEKTGEHPAGSCKRPPDMAKRPCGAERGRPLAATPQPSPQSGHSEDRTKKDHFGDREHRRGPFDHRHEREGEGRADL